MTQTTNENSTFDALLAGAGQADPTLAQGQGAPIAFPIEQVVGRPAAAKLKRIQRIRRDLLAGSYQQQDVLDKVVDRLWADMQAFDEHALAPGAESQETNDADQA